MGKPKAAKKAGKAKAAFGGYQLNFKGRAETMEEVFGSAPIGPSEMTAKIWEFVKANGIAGRPA